MGKRSDFERVPRDFYPTPYEAVVPLINHVLPSYFVEPCAGDGVLINHLQGAGWKCLNAYDIEPQAAGIKAKDALSLTPEDVHNGYKEIYLVTNPPWDRKVLHPMIDHFVTLAPTWLLIDADWMHTGQSSYYMSMCQEIVSVGRVKWIPDSKMTGMDNCCWYLFRNDKNGPTEFYGR